MKNLDSLWNDFETKNEKGYEWHARNLHLVGLQHGPIFNLFFQYLPEERPLTFFERHLDSFLSKTLPSKAWSFNTQGICPKLCFSPSFPERPLVLSLKRRFFVLSESMAIFDLWLPLDLSISCPTFKRHLGNFHLAPLKETWFGECSAKGEICYSVKEIKKPEISSLYFSMKVKIINKSPHNFPVEKIKIPLSYMGLYQNEQKEFYSDTLIFKQDLSPEHEPKIQLISPNSQEKKKSTLLVAPQKTDINFLSKALSKIYD